MKYYYETLRFTNEDPPNCIEEEYVAGEILGEYLKSLPEVPKEQFFIWLHEITNQLSLGEKIILSPFHIVLTTDQRIAFLAPLSKMNQKHIQRLRNNKYYSVFIRLSKINPLYSYGTVIQYLLKHSQIVPRLNRKEIKKMNRLFLECDIRKRAKMIKLRFWRFVLWISVIILFLAVALNLYNCARYCERAQSLTEQGGKVKNEYNGFLCNRDYATRRY